MFSPAAIRETQFASREQFEDEIAAAGEPVVLRGPTREWPLAAAARESDAALVKYLEGFHNGAPVSLMTGPPAIDGRLFYTGSLRSLNFQTIERKFGHAMQAILGYASDPSPPTLYMGSASTAKHWPGLAQENRLPLLPESVVPNLWIGNRAVVGPHNDIPDNIACVVAGRRRFRLFPPEQFANLYVGPLELNPAGRPVSYVSVTEPDFGRYPRYRDALAASREATLEPGDAIYIPSLWWHSVESLTPFNALANYWWDLPGANAKRAEAALIHALLAFAAMTPRQRKGWQAVFDHLVFRGNGDPVAHIPPEVRGWLADLSPDLRDQMKNLIRQSLIE